MLSTTLMDFIYVACIHICIINCAFWMHISEELLILVTVLFYLTATSRHPREPSTDTWLHNGASLRGDTFLSLSRRVHGRTDQPLSDNGQGHCIGQCILQASNQGRTLGHYARRHKVDGFAPGAIAEDSCPTKAADRSSRVIFFSNLVFHLQSKFFKQSTFWHWYFFVAWQWSVIWYVQMMTTV